MDSFLWVLRTRSPLSGLEVEAQFQGFLSRYWKQYVEFPGLPSSRVSLEFPVMSEHLAMLPDQAQDC